MGALFLPYKKISFNSSLTVVQVNYVFENIVEWQKSKILPFLRFLHVFDYRKNYFKTNWRIGWRFRLLVEGSFHPETNTVEITVRYHWFAYAVRIFAYFVYLVISIVVIQLIANINYPFAMVLSVCIALLLYMIELLIFNYGFNQVWRKMRGILS